MLNKRKNVIGLVLLLLLMVGSLSFSIAVSAAEKQTIYNSPYVSFSPDGEAWTTNAGDQDYEWYEKGTRVTTGITSSLRALQEGEHYYKVSRTGEIPVGYWEVAHSQATCIHNDYPGDDRDFHGVVFGTSKCEGYYYSGWFPYCADCGDEIVHMYHYMSREAAESIDYIDLDAAPDVFYRYYYLCPHCNNLEQGSAFQAHKCNAISWNRYLVVYHPNSETKFSGYMEDSVHYYNNATEYEGELVTPVTHLTKNAYTRIGYVFTGWNTEPDGSGTAYADGAEILNLTTENWQLGKDEGIITLYAQWRPSSSTLQIDPAGGSYQGNNGVTSVTKDYGSTYTLDDTEVTPPAGYTVFFDVNGGDPVASITGTQHFVEWSMGQPFEGRMKNDNYFFLAPDGSIDTLTAVYAHDPITLPGASKPGSSFGGWYYDEAFQEPAGGAGDTINPGKDVTLYAQWVELKLFSEENYTANGGKGAADLSWIQPDGKDKTYLLYQSSDGENWERINTAEDIGSQRTVEKSFSYTGTAGRYTVPYSGFYTLTAQGAQGGSYGEYAGGYGGSVRGKFWLRKGEVITYTIGGQNGYNGGGAATMYGNGGGCTVVSSDQKGTLLIAGGGGGATVTGNGGAGGSSASVLATGISGQSGGAGGGGGYRGGSAGEYILHHHTPLQNGETQNGCYVNTSGSLITKYGVNTEASDITLYDSDGKGHAGRHIVKTIGSRENLIPVKAGATLDLEAYYYWMYANETFGYNGEENGIKVYDQNGNLLASQTVDEISAWISGEIKRAAWDIGIRTDAWNRQWELYKEPNLYTPANSTNVTNVSYEGEFNSYHKFWLTWDGAGNVYKNSYLSEYEGDTTLGSYQSNAAAMGYPERILQGGSIWYYSVGTQFRKEITIPEGVTGIYIVYDVKMVHHHTDDSAVQLQKADLNGMVNLICGYDEGQVVSSKPAYGGSNYVNTGCAGQAASKAGVRGGNGAFSVSAVNVGYQDSLELKGVAAPDRAAPDRISLGTVEKEPVGNDRVKVTWAAPADNGTTYYHQAESYLSGSETVLCRSNITMDTLTTGVRGYYYRLAGSSGGTVDAANGTYLSDSNGKGGTTVALTGTVQYLLVAAVDVAGNVGETAAIRIGSLDGAEDVLWGLYTEQLGIDAAENVYPAAQDKTYYVRSDGETPFTLHYSAYMDGPATADYQPNHIIFGSEADGISSRNIFTAASEEIRDGEIPVPMDKVSYTAENAPLLARGGSTAITRKDKVKRLEDVQQFLLQKEASGKRILVTPSVGADHRGETFYSDEGADAKNALTLIGDGEAPVIGGLELLEDRELIDRRDGTVTLQVTAVDDLSGVGEFYLKIYNTDNAVEKTWTPGEDGSIRVVITEDEPVFSGDFTVTACAVDNVGNRREETFSTTEFSMETKVERILEPHDPVFKCGESGILTITTWGYADRVEVEFPAEMTALDPELATVYSYTLTPKYRQEEQLQFMIPLYTPANTAYTITVRAYKGDKQLEDHPDMSVIAVDGSVLDEIRTRLR